MKTTLFYFSGTGNSLSASRQVATFLGDTDLIPIVKCMERSGDFTAPDGRIGIVCPVYDLGIPVIVRDFLRRLVLDKGTYCFALLTYAGMGASALKMADACLREQNGRGLSAGFMVRMPGNFPPLYTPPAGAKRDAILRSAESEISLISKKIQGNQEFPLRFAPLDSLLHMLLYGGFAKGVHNSDEKFSVSDACTSCGICSSVCPVGNISMNEGRPVWNHQCELCCGCLNYCPTQAIDLNLMFGTKGRGRYHHPQITTSDLKEQQGRRE